MKNLFFIVCLIIPIFQNCGSSKKVIETPKPTNSIEYAGTTNNSTSETECDKTKKYFDNFKTNNYDLVQIYVERDFEGNILEKISPSVRGGELFFKFPLKLKNFDANQKIYPIEFEFLFTPIPTQATKIQNIEPVSFFISTKEFEENRYSNKNYKFIDCYLNSLKMEESISRNSSQNAFDMMYAAAWTVKVKVTFKSMIAFDGSSTYCPDFLSSNWSKGQKSLFLSCE